MQDTSRAAPSKRTSMAVSVLSTSCVPSGNAMWRISPLAVRMVARHACHGSEWLASHSAGPAAISPARP
ncbi:hypothetical protein [Janthinobacterium sp. HLS12-2]|uniref:hypothetical protein n=1 Tax=Janthinobacterium sp. HLS12-2 TaxID=1259324 RepID=UPI003F273F24